MDRGSDVFRTMRWGLRRYAWVIVLCALALGAVLPILQAQSEDVYETSALVEPKDELTMQNLDALPKWGEGIFANGAVAEQVRTILGLPPGEPVVPQHVELQTAQDDYLFKVFARDPDPKTAQEVANGAASILALEMSSSAAVGTFTVQSGAELPRSPLPELGDRQALVLAPVAGGIAGLGIVLLLLVVRQPVLDAAAAEGATGARVLGQVGLPHRRRGVEADDVTGLAGLSRRLLAGHGDTIMLVSPNRSATARARLLPVLVNVLEQVRRVRVRSGGELEPADNSGFDGRSQSASRARSRRSRPARKLLVVDQPTSTERAVRSDGTMIVLVVPTGIALASLRQAAAEYLDGDPMGVVLVHRQRLRWGRPRARASLAPSGTDPEDQAPDLDSQAGGANGVEASDNPDDDRSFPFTSPDVHGEPARRR